MGENDFTKIPKFLRRLYRETSDPMNAHIVWSDDGERIRIVNKDKFIKHTLHTLSRTKEYSAFIRQLNIYGFVKVKNEKNDDIEEYYNCFFKKDQPSLMEFMKRVKKVEKVETRLNHPSIENSINYLTNANFRLSNEISQLRDRVDKQDRTINGLLDILGRVFRTGAQNMGYETSAVKPRPDLFLNYGLEEKKEARPERSLDVFGRNNDEAKKKDNKYITDMNDIFF